MICYLIWPLVNLSQIVTNPTKITPSASSIIGLVFVNNNFLEYSYNCEVVTGISNHEMVLCNLALEYTASPQNNLAMYLNFINASDVDILDSLDDNLELLGNVLDDCSANINQLWLVFKEIVNHCVDTFISPKRKVSRLPNPWITRDILGIKHRLSKIRKQKKNFSAVSYRSRIKDISFKLKNNIKTARYKYYNTTLFSFFKSSPLDIWRHISHLQSKNKTKNVPLTSELFNNYFKLAFTADVTPAVSFDMYDSLPQEDNIIITKTGIASLLLNLDVKKSPGPDNIPNAFLKRYAEHVAEYLLLLFTFSINFGIVPAN